MQTLLYSFIAGVSTVAGVFVLLVFGNPTEKILATLLGFAAGIMLGISVFELMPEALLLGTMTITIIGFILGVLMMFGLDKLVPHSHLSSADDLEVENPEKLISIENPIVRTGYLVLFGIALHNLPEGLAIGAGLESSPELGLAIAVAIALHNIPEGLAIAGPLKSGGVTAGKLFLFTFLAGLMTPLGAGIGLLIFNVSPVLVGGSLAFAAGAMVYIVNDELIPQGHRMNSHLSNGGIIAGLLVAFALL